MKNVLSLSGPHLDSTSEIHLCDFTQFCANFDDIMFIYSLYTKISENYANNQSHIPIVLAYIAQHLLTHMFEILLIFMS